MPKPIPPPKGNALKAEIVKCGTDPVYFLKTYGYISHPKRGLIAFKTYPFQDECIEQFEKFRHNVVLKSRQLGLSTICAGYALWVALFQREKNILIIATKLEVAKNFVRKVKTILQNLPPWLILPKISGESVKHLEFSNGSRITAIPTGEDAGRSEGVSLLIVDEAAHIQGFDNLWINLYSTVSTGGNIILLSTPKGVGNVFHKVWMESDAEKKTNDFHGIRLPWTVHPEHDESWFQEQCRNLDSRGIQQELLCSFLGSGQTYLHESSLAYINEIITPPIEKAGQDGNFWVWKYPVPTNRYIISADVARGDSDDFSSCHVIDVDQDEVAAEYQGKIPPDRFGEFLVDIGYRYNTALICPENNTFGLTTAYKIRDLKYPKLYYEKFAKNGIYQNPSPEEVEGEIPGISTNVKNRQFILAKLEEILRNRKLKIYSSRFSEEAKTFIWNTNVAGGKAMAMKGYNDDLIMSLGIGCFLFETSENQTNDAEIIKAMLAAMSKSTTRLTENQMTGQNQNVPAGGMSFQRISHNSPFAYNNQKPHYQKPATQENMKPGVSAEQARPTVDMYNMFSWLFDK
jgi:hypothetical protein